MNDGTPIIEIESHAGAFAHHGSSLTALIKDSSLTHNQPCGGCDSDGSHDASVTKRAIRIPSPPCKIALAPATVEAGAPGLASGT